MSHPSLSLRSPPLPVLDSSSHTASRHLRGHSPGLLVLGLVARRATESGQGVHELGLSEVEYSGLCSLPSCSFVLRRLHTTPRSSYYLICPGYELSMSWERDGSNQGHTQVITWFSRKKICWRTKTVNMQTNYALDLVITFDMPVYQVLLYSVYSDFLK